MSKPNKKENIVKPGVRINNIDHPLEAIFGENEEDMPEVKSVGYMNFPKGTKLWTSYTITSKGRRIISIEVDEPNLRAIAQDSAKIAFVQLFVDAEGPDGSAKNT